MKQKILLILLVINILFLSVVGVNANYKYESTGVFNVSDGEREVQLTNGSNQTTSMWNADKIDLTRDFVLSYKVFLGSKTNYGEGMTLTFHNDQQGLKAIGGGDECLGVYDCSGKKINNAFAIEFDTTYSNIPSLDYGADDTTIPQIVDTNKLGHVAFMIPSQYTRDHYNLHYNVFNPLSNDSFHDVLIKWNATSRMISFQFDDSVEQFHDLKDYKNILKSDHVFWGFTAATSAIPAKFVVKDIDLQYKDVTMIMQVKNDNVNGSYASLVNSVVNDELQIKLEIKSWKELSNATIQLDIQPGLEIKNDTIVFNNTDVNINKNNEIEIKKVPLGGSTLTFSLTNTSEQNKRMSASIDSNDNARAESNSIEILQNGYRKLIYDGNGSDGGDVDVEDAPVLVGSTVFVNNPGSLYKNGYVFDHWNTKMDDKGTQYRPLDKFKISNNGNTLYAIWKPIEESDIIVRFLTSDKGVIQGETNYAIKRGSHLSAYPSVKPSSGYSFVGWRKGEVVVDLDDYIFNDDTTLMAQYVRNAKKFKLTRLAEGIRYELLNGKTLTSRDEIDKNHEKLSIDYAFKESNGVIRNTKPIYKLNMVEEKEKHTETNYILPILLGAFFLAMLGIDVYRYKKQRKENQNDNTN